MKAIPNGHRMYEIKCRDASLVSLDVQSAYERDEDARSAVEEAAGGMRSTSGTLDLAGKCLKLLNEVRRDASGERMDVRSMK